jgi:hypothetical protein
MYGHIKNIERLAPDEQVAAYAKLAKLYHEFSLGSFTSGTKQLFSDWSRELEERATSVITWT